MALLVFIDLPLFARYHNLIVDHPQNTDVLTFSPTKTKNLALGHDNSQMYYDALDFHFDDSCWINSMDYCFYLGHKFLQIIYLDQYIQNLLVVVG